VFFADPLNYSKVVGNDKPVTHPTWLRLAGFHSSCQVQAQKNLDSFNNRQGLSVCEQNFMNDQER